MIQWVLVLYITGNEYIITKKFKKEISCDTYRNRLEDKVKKHTKCELHGVYDSNYKSKKAIDI